MTHSELNRLDLDTINAASSVIAAAIENQVCRWEQQSADCAAHGRLFNALMFENLAFAANLLRSITSTELTNLFCKAADIQFSSMPTLDHDDVLVEVS